MNQIVSLVVPIYNGATFLPRLANSLKAQTYEHLEIILIDDASSDDSFELLKNLIRDDTRFNIFRSPINTGTACGVVAKYLNLVTGDYFQYVSQDDWFSEDWIDRMVTKAQDTCSDAVLPDMAYVDDAEVELRLAGVNGDRTVILKSREAVVPSLDWQIPGCALWRTDHVKEVGWHGSDRLFCSMLPNRERA